MFGTWVLALAVLCLGTASGAENGDDEDSIRKAAFEMYSEGRMEKALELFEKSLSWAPDDVAVLQAVGFILYRAEEFDRAESRFRSSIAVGGETAYPLFMLGNIAFRQFRLAEAKRNYRRVRSLAPDYPSLAENEDLLDRRIDRVKILQALRKRCDRFYWGSISAGALLLILLAALEFFRASGSIEIKNKAT